jgi:hypothetical protein
VYLLAISHSAAAMKLSLTRAPSDSFKILPASWVINGMAPEFVDY